jgi:hypothetical protein
MSPETLEGVKALIEEKYLPKTDKELAWLAAIIEDAVKRNGADWVRENPESILRQWQYCEALL